MDKLTILLGACIIGSIECARLLRLCVDLEHNCQTCAGFIWCNSTSECVRPWETFCPDWIPVPSHTPHMLL